MQIIFKEKIMLFKNLTKTIKTEDGTTVISYSGNEKTYTLPNGDVIKTVYSDNEKEVTFPGNQKIELTSKNGVAYIKTDADPEKRIIDMIAVKSENNKIIMLDNCNDCKFCILVCPEDAIGLKVGRVVFIRDCTGCGACITECPLTVLFPKN